MTAPPTRLEERILERSPIEEESMIRMFVRHPVADFGKWKQAYDDFDETRNGMGVRGQSVFQSLEDPNDVTAWHDFDSIEAAKAFVESPQLRAAMAAAGVSGEPTIWFARKA